MKNPNGSDDTATQATKTMMSTLSYGMQYGLGVGNPNGKFQFEDVRHRALRGPKDGDVRYESDISVDFYTAGCDFFRPSIDLPRSLVLGQEYLNQGKAQLDAGENVVFLANHQSEADPQVVSCLFEQVSPTIDDLAADICYVAEHKVTTDALAVPFSMGRNLCASIRRSI
jgi:glycerol-3-phosphate O-acyltransferase